MERNSPAPAEGREVKLVHRDAGRSLFPQDGAAAAAGGVLRVAPEAVEHEKEASEATYHLMLARDLGYIKEEDATTLLKRFDVLGRMLNRLYAEVRDQARVLRWKSSGPLTEKRGGQLIRLLRRLTKE